MKKTIILRVPKNGLLTGDAKPVVEVEGCTGFECRDFSGMITRALGQVGDEVLKSDAFVEQPENQHIRQQGK